MWTTVATVTGSLLAGGTASSLAVRGHLFKRGIHKRRNLEAEIEAKDRTIATNEQTITALSERVELLEKSATQLEETVTRLQGSLNSANAAVAALQARYETLQAFAAPHAFHVIDLKLDAVVQQILDSDAQTVLAAKLSDPRIPPRAA